MKQFLLFFFVLTIAAAFVPQRTYGAGNIVQFGDSLTQGMYQSGGLVEKYQSAGFAAVVPGDNGSHGYFGKSISSVLGAIDANASNIKSANSVVVELGTNPGGTGQAGAIRSDMSLMIDKIRGINSSVQIFWVNLVVVQPANADEYSARNKAIADVSASKNVSLINWYKRVFPSGDPTSIQPIASDPNNWIVDRDLGIHLSGTGYQAMADTIVQAVKNGGTSGSSSSTSPKKNPNAPYGPVPCSGREVELGYAKHILPYGEKSGHPAGKCFVPLKIVMHDTQGDLTPEGYYDFWANGANGAETAVQFVIGKDGTVLQLTKLFSDTAEAAEGVADNNFEAISIELVSKNPFNGKSEVPQPQYDAAVKLVRELMQTYNIPLSDKDYNWKSSQWKDGISETAGYKPDSGEGVFGHYQLNPPPFRFDPGEGFMRDLNKDIKNSGIIQPLNNATASKSSLCVITKVGIPLFSPTPPPFCNLAAGSNATGLLKAAEDIKTAYNTPCGKPEAYFTFFYEGQRDCLKQNLLAMGNDAKKVDSFISRIGPIDGSSVISHSSKYDPKGSTGSCVECLGYIDDSIALYTGVAAGTANSASGVRSGFTRGDYKFTVIDKTQIQPGDIAVSTTDNHIVIVKEVKSNQIFIAIESNGDYNCRITDTKDRDKNVYDVYLHPSL